MTRWTRPALLAMAMSAACDQDAEFAAVPGHDLVYPDASLLSQGVSGVQGRKGAPATSHHYGSNDEHVDHFAWWDRELARLGYGARNAGPTPKRLFREGAQQGAWQHPTGHWYAVSVTPGPCLVRGTSHPYKQCIYQEVLPRRLVQ